MENNAPVSPHPANSQTDVFGPNSVTPPTCETYADGQSVENVLSPTAPISTIQSYSEKSHSILPIEGEMPPCGAERVRSFWFVIRATRGRAQEVYDAIVGLHIPNLEAYIPRYHVETLKIDNGNPVKIIQEGILHNGIVFVRTTRKEFTKLVHGLEPYPVIKGLTPYYDHFREIETGRNNYLIVPDKQFRDFRTILESEDVNILVDQDQMPTYLNGKKVEVTSGPFAGITGTLLRWKGLRRVFIKLDQLGTYATSFVRTCDFRIIED